MVFPSFFADILFEFTVIKTERRKECKQGNQTEKRKCNKQKDSESHCRNRYLHIYAKGMKNRKMERWRE